MEYARMRPGQISAAVSNGLALLMPVGVLEYHGQQNPVGLDALIAEGVAKRVAKEVPCVLAPTQFYGYSGQWAGGVKDGEVHIDGDALYGYVKPILKAFYAQGWRKIYVICHHQGAKGVTMLSYQRAASEVAMEYAHERGGPGWSESTNVPPGVFSRIAVVGDGEFSKIGYAGHGGKGETQAMMALCPGTVDLSVWNRDTDSRWARDAGEATPEEGEQITRAIVASWKKELTQMQPRWPLPSPRQLKWHDLEVYGFLHFGVNTFTGKGWGEGDEPESLFNPTDFDADQIAQTAKEAGMKGLMLTAKHHDGFCLWPSKYTEHSVKNSPWRGGKGDVVREISEACARHGLKFGVYLSPWDRNSKDYGMPAYITYYRNQLRELLTNYGPIFEVWFDGANGGMGYYGGARERRTIDRRTYYDWKNTWEIVRELQPDACMFSDGGPDCRWVGNEAGHAGETCWSTFNRDDVLPGVCNASELNCGQRKGTHWLPAEVDVSIRPEWFYRAQDDNAVKSVQALLKIYDESVGRGCNLILNIPPDKRGKIHENDVKVLREWRRVLEATFANDFARGAKATASDTRLFNQDFGPDKAVDGDRETYWATGDAVTTPELVLDMGKPVTFNVVRVREYLPLGQRVDSFAVDAWKDGAWVPLASATSIGNQRLLPVALTTATRVRLRITKAEVCPAISEFALFMRPAP